MKTFKKILLGLFILVIALVVIAFFLPKNVHIERSIAIDTSAKVVYNQVNDLRSWDKWAVWNQIDPEMTVKYINSGIGENAGYSWTSEHPQVGNGELMITTTVPYDSIAIFMNFMEEGTATGYFLFKENEGSTNVKWVFENDLGYNPAARWFGLMIDAMIGPDLKKGLENLKVVSETMEQEKQPIVEIVDLPATKIISIREDILFSELDLKMALIYGEITRFIEKENLIMADVPLAIYHKIDGNLIDLEGAIPVNQFPEITEGNMIARELKAGKYVHADHFGSYQELEKTHAYIQNWVEKHNLTISGGPMERYLTDPELETDSSKFLTAIYYPI